MGKFFAVGSRPSGRDRARRVASRIITPVQRSDDVRHELGNLLAVALANVEGMVDGLVPPTAARLESLADALRRAKDLLQRGDRT